MDPGSSSPHATGDAPSPPLLADQAYVGLRDRLDRAELMDLDARVHRFIYRCADNPYLAETCDRYFNLSLRIWYLALDRMPDLPDHVRGHQDVLAAIAAGDPERAAAALGAHIQGFERAIRDVL